MTVEENSPPPLRDAYRRHYSRWHDDSDAHFEEMARGYERKLAGLLSPERAISVLEIGCGPGFCLGGLRLLGIEGFEGIDADAGQVQAAQSRALPAEHVPVAQFRAYAEAHRSRFDAILMFDVLEHVPDEARPAFLGQVWSMLKPGGRLIGQVPNANSIVASRYRYIDATHHTSFTEASLDFELYRAGFEDIVVSEAEPIQRPWLRSPRDIMRWAMRRTLRHVLRRCYELEIGADAWSLPLSPNLLVTAFRRLTTTGAATQVQSGTLQQQ